MAWQVLQDYWDDIVAQDWQPVPKVAAAGLSLLAGYVVWQHFFTADCWVFLLDHANLAIHEAGHPIVGLFSEQLAVYGGTIFQLLFPLLFAHHFWKQRQSLGFAAAWLWLGESAMNVARYMKDARAQQLPLVGGGEHDWTEIFSRWGMLGSDTRVGGLFSFLGICACLVTLLWLWRKTGEPE